MLIDIQRTVIRVQLRRLITLLLICAIVLTVILVGNRNVLHFGLNKYAWGVVIGAVYLLAMMVEAWLELNYLYYTDQGDTLIFRYFSMSIFNRKKNSIEIPTKVFAGYEIKVSLRGLKKKIILMQRIKDKVVKYPAVSLTSLKKEEYVALLKNLDKYKGT